jgi:hypothetical protein
MSCLEGLVQNVNALAGSPKWEMRVFLCWTSFLITVLKKDLTTLCDMSHIIDLEQC